MKGGEYMGYVRLSFIMIAMVLFAFSSLASGENIDPDNDGSQFCYGENIGWINLQPSQGPGITVTDTAVSGMAWGENVGWINFSPSNGGVVNDGNGILSGYAWGENVGWIKINPAGAGVIINTATGLFSGKAWGENIGWINCGPFSGAAKTSWKKALTLMVAPSGPATGTVTITSDTGNINCTWDGLTQGGVCASNPITTGTPVTLTAGLPAGTVINWGAGCNVATSTQCTITSLTANTTISPITSIITYTLSYVAGPNGSISGTSPQTVNHGANGSPVTAVPNIGYHFVNWSDGSTANPRQDVNVTANISVTANFAINTYTVTPTAGPNGSINPNTPQTVNHGSTASFTVTPDPGYAASVGGTCGGSPSGNTYTTNPITANCKVIATFIDAMGPVVTFLQSNPNPAPINTQVILSATLDDSQTGNSPIKDAEYRIDGGSYLPMATQDGIFDEPVEEVSSTIAGFSIPGVYEICVKGRDVFDNETTSDECMLLPIYDPEGGFVTGGGWINSPAGAYTPDPLLTGKATFGFVSKYKKGASVPTGVTEFQFKVADLNFHSDAYEWLVIAGAKAQYKGTGTINGQGMYKFMITAIDADINKADAFNIDRFRIKIWSEDSAGNETVIYDNALGSDSDAALTEIGGGSIVIHTSKK
jgi:hypothetical protein